MAVRRRDRTGRFNRRGRFVARNGMLVRIETISRPLTKRQVKKQLEELADMIEESEEEVVTVEFGGAFDSP